MNFLGLAWHREFLPVTPDGDLERVPEEQGERGHGSVVSQKVPGTMRPM
jgi:hypothetical protein